MELMFGTELWTWKILCFCERARRSERMGEKEGLGASTGEARESENASKPWPSRECAWPWVRRFSPLSL